MRSTIIVPLLFFSTLASAAPQDPEGRWEGSIQIPGRELPLVVDLGKNAAGSWVGSMIVQGLSIKGAALANVVVTDQGIAFDSGSALTTSYGPAQFSAKLSTDDRIAGEMNQGGNIAKFALVRIGPAQVETPKRSTAVGAEIADQWTGDYELGGYPRHVTIAFENRPDGSATATFVIVGKQRTELPVDLVTAEGSFVRIESQAYRAAFEGRFVKEAQEIRGTIELGPTDLPLVLHRSSVRKS